MSDITIEALKAAGFEDLKDGAFCWWNKARPMDTPSIYHSMSGNFSVLDKGIKVLFDGVNIYPTNMAQIETLKELLTPK